MKVFRLFILILLMACSSMVGSKCVAQTIRDANHHNIGRISPNGTVRDGESRVLGNIDKSGKIYDANKRIIGYAQGVRYEWIACYFFFHFFD